PTDAVFVVPEVYVPRDHGVALPRLRRDPRRTLRAQRRLPDRAPPQRRRGRPDPVRIALAGANRAALGDVPARTGDALDSGEVVVRDPGGGRDLRRGAEHPRCAVHVLGAERVGAGSEAGVASPKSFTPATPTTNLSTIHQTPVVYPIPPAHGLGLTTQFR